MSTETERPWVPTGLQPSKRKQAVSDELRAAFREVWEVNPDNFQDKQTSTDNNEAINGTVAFDKFDVARLLSNHIRKQHPDWASAALNPAQIGRRIHWAADDAGVSRNAMIARKAEYKALQEAAPVGEQSVDEQSLDGRRDNGSTDPAQPE